MRVSEIVRPELCAKARPLEDGRRLAGSDGLAATPLSLPRDQVVVEKLEYFNPLGALGWWAQRLVRHASLESAGVSRQVHVFDRYMVPVSRRVNRITKGWFGQSVICVARKL